MTVVLPLRSFVLPQNLAIAIANRDTTFFPFPSGLTLVHF